MGGCGSKPKSSDDNLSSQPPKKCRSGSRSPALVPDASTTKSVAEQTASTADREVAPGNVTSVEKKIGDDDRKEEGGNESTNNECSKKQEEKVDLVDVQPQPEEPKSKNEETKIVPSSTPSIDATIGNDVDVEKKVEAVDDVHVVPAAVHNDDVLVNQEKVDDDDDKSSAAAPSVVEKKAIVEEADSSAKANDDEKVAEKAVKEAEVVALVQPRVKAEKTKDDQPAAAAAASVNQKSTD